MASLTINSDRKAFASRLASDSPSDGMADIRDLKSRGEKSPCGFDSRLGHAFFTSDVALLISFPLLRCQMSKCDVHSDKLPISGVDTEREKVKKKNYLPNIAYGNLFQEKGKI